MIHVEARVLIRTESMSKYCKLGNRTGEAVRSLDTRIMQGEFVMIQGISGNQKNAFFNLLGCLERPEGGKYFFDYEDIALVKEEMLSEIRRSRIGYLFRDHRLINRLTVRQNIVVPMDGLSISRQEKENRIERSLKSIGIEGIEGEKVSALSDFDKQSVSLARAIVNNPLMIIADDPTANLSTDEEGQLMEQLWRLNGEGITIVLFASENKIKALGRYRLITFDNGSLSSDKEENGSAF